MMPKICIYIDKVLGSPELAERYRPFIKAEIDANPGMGRGFKRALRTAKKNPGEYSARKVLIVDGVMP